ncbi:MAG: [FeFe] hydrogenase H-cluster maturation GTPase HydF [Phascolarctobacterium sp.]|nr:[FeFe] hydrogenase H-cluster maturation GTPase HydF [Phascolarctobacterium sp.]
MSLNNTPSGERLHIGIFGKRNAGKSSLINALTNQDLAIVSEQKGTTTDPVSKAMELLPLGPVVIIDTPGFDDEGELGALRVQKAKQVLNKTDIAILVVDATLGISQEDVALWSLIQEKKLPSVLVINKSEAIPEMQQALLAMHALKLTKSTIFVSAKTKKNINELRDLLGTLQPQEKEKQIVGELINPLDIVVLVTPIDSAAPKGRLILPQQLVLRNVIDNKGIALVVQESELEEALSKLTVKPKLIVTDSQVFGKVNKIVPRDIPLTSFSILMAHYKGNLYDAVKAAKVLEQLEDGDKVLISEGCTHHRQCGDIGTQKLPAWIRSFTKAEPDFTWTSGTEFPEDLSPYKLIIHCGGCMLNEKEMQHRGKVAREQQVPMTNYGIAIAHMNGILARTLEPLQEYKELLNH